MKKKLRIPFLLSGAIFMSTMLFGQLNTQNQEDKFAYAVTDSVKDGVKWNFLRKIDLNTGTFSQVLLPLLGRNDTIANSPLCNGVAAIALDNKNKRLYFTSMLTDRLSYVNLRNMRIHVVTNNFTGRPTRAADQSDVITRMVIAPDGWGYAITNDANHLIRFGIHNNPVKDLGPLIDAPGNNVSVHEFCSSFGGDIITAGDDILYLVTSRNNVFKINIRNRVAKYLGTISGLPEHFITSGAAVDYRGNNRIIIGSSADASLYSVNLKTLLANELGTVNPWKIADLANSNSVKVGSSIWEKPELYVNVTANNEQIRLYPNPVTSDELKIEFSSILTGDYTVQVISAMGQVITTKVLKAGGKANVYSVNLPGSVSKGIYIVRIVDKANKAVYNEKIVVH